MHYIHGNFLGAAIVCIINLILVDVGAFKPISRPVLIVVNIVLDLLIIVLMGLFFRSLP